MIDQATIDRIIETAQIVDVVSDFVSLKRRGANYTGLCPFHNEKTPSFSVSPAKNLCKCFSCGKGGGPVGFIMEHEQMSFLEAIRYLAKKYGIEIQERELSDDEKREHSDRESMLTLNAFAQKAFTDNLFETDEGINVGLSYFRERGFRPEIIKKFQLGYCHEQRSHFAQFALKNGYNKDFLLKTGLAYEGNTGDLIDRFRGRVMFPIHSLSGKVKGFGGRILGNKDKIAKYVNSPESLIYHKSNELYGIFFAKGAIAKEQCCFLVEGYTDVISMYQAGVENVVASSGTALTEGQIHMIHRLTQNIIVLYDGDAAGIKASLRGIDLILKEGMNVKVVLLPEGEDPDSFSRRNSASQFRAYIEQNAVDFIRYKTNLLLKDASNDPRKMAELINDVVKSIAIIPDAIERSIYIKETSQLLEISEKDLVHEVSKILQEEAARPSSYNKARTFPKAEEKETLPAAEPSATSVASAPSYKPSALDRFEYAIIRYVIRYGHKPLYTDSEIEEPAPLVMQYILNDLNEDEISFHFPLYKKIFEQAQHIPSGQSFETFFINHADPDISKFAVDVVAERYQLSKIHTKYATVETEEDKLMELVPRAIFELKDAMIRIEIQRLNEQIKAAGSQMPIEKLVATMQEIAQFNELRTALAKELGERIISPFIR